MIHECKICGKLFTATSKNNTLCSSECREISRVELARISKRERQRRKKMKTNNAKKIIDMNAEAKALGMSYGRYVAYMSMKEGK